MDRSAALDAIETHVLEALTNAQNRMASLRESLTSESKSTAGDKHETGRAMVHREMEQAALAEGRAAESLQRFRQITAAEPGATAGQGSLVKTANGWFFLGLPVGKIMVDGIPVFGVSLASPIGQVLKGVAEGDVPNFQQKPLKIEAVS